MGKFDTSSQQYAAHANWRQRLGEYPLMEALLQRRSRRFAPGLTLNGGPLAYTSGLPPQPLTLEEEAVLAFAGCGITGAALAELPFQDGGTPEAGGGNIMVHFIGRTIPSADAMHCVLLFVLNDQGVWMLKRPCDFPRDELPDLIRQAHRRQWVELYQKHRVRLAENRLDVPKSLPFVPGFNQWSANQPGTTYFLPVNELTAITINVLLSMFSEDFGYYVVDDRHAFRPAGLASFARSKGGHLNDDPSKGRVVTLGSAHK